jgi:hypothetical protein
VPLGCRDVSGRCGLLPDGSGRFRGVSVGGGRSGWQ